ncbi:Putative lumazine-binding [Chitinophaga eiseniae]|uniref:Putative lumazine-binding n=1 Tax=Chitinophaga eiseniae TaxID=634771 RepID=A0A1T4TVI9_9BACT|nr:nuclear transport factor 2 family protein [Chitinophaga eiseniae]SKA44475.1 Putative lumazine-binding [Chitinophaga eiseniae]
MNTPANKIGVENEEHLILLTLNNYLEGRPTLDIERLRAAFHPDAYIRTVIDGKLVQWALPQYLELVAQAAVQECRPELLSFTWDGDTGSAHVQLTFDTFRFIDRFNLIKLDGKWQIMDKVSYREALLPIRQDAPIISS